MVVSAFIGTLHLDSLDVDSLLGLPDPDPGHGHAALPGLTCVIIFVLGLTTSALAPKAL